MCTVHHGGAGPGGQVMSGVGSSLLVTAAQLPVADVGRSACSNDQREGLWHHIAQYMLLYRVALFWRLHSFPLGSCRAVPVLPYILNSKVQGKRFVAYGTLLCWNPPPAPTSSDKIFLHFLNNEYFGVLIQTDVALSQSMACSVYIPFVKWYYLQHSPRRPVIPVYTQAGSYFH